MLRDPRLSSLNLAEESAAIRDWLREAAACLVDGRRPLPAPPHPDLQPTFDAVLAGRREMEQSHRDLVESLRMQSLQTVGSMLAHDLHNLSLRLALLSQNLDRFYGDPSFLQSTKRVLDDTVERMRGLVDNFRERQENIIIKIPADIDEVLRALVRQMHLQELRNVRLVEDYRAQAQIWADPFFLANGFRVLLENGIEAMPKGGWLGVRTRSPAGVPPGIVVEIEDTGMGMTREFVERELFAPFRSGGGHGLGLGMYICRQIIHLHDGSIQVSSEPGRGTCFRLTFPVALKQP